MNGIKTVLLLSVLSGILLFGGELIGGRNGLYTAVAIAIGLNFFSYFFSDRLALAAYSARPLSQTENPEIYNRLYPIVFGLAQRMNIPMPKLRLLPDESPNAFATGRNPNNASVAVTAGILRIMNDRELEGVLAHELGHVINRDILTSSIAATLAMAITFLARMAFWFGGAGGRDDENRGSPIAALAMLILAPIAALLIQMSISRTREYAADATSAEVTHDPGELISALGKLETWSKRIPMADANPATAHMFIVKPFTGKSMMQLFSTHPSTEDRIRRLEAMRVAGVR